MPDRPVKITFAQMCNSGVRGILVYCGDYKCSHSLAISGCGNSPSRMNLALPYGDQFMPGILFVPSRGRSRAARKVFQTGGVYYSVS
jgi:hypothetical protein